MIVHPPEYLAARAARYKAKAKERKLGSPKVEVSATRLNELFSYSIITGQLIRKITVNYKALAGQVIDFKHNAGYYYVAVDGVRLLAHRVIWCMVVGEWPVATIDHRDTNRANNSWLNLREATRLENNRNTSGWGNTLTGVKGVSPARAKGRFSARITVNHNPIHLGTFDTKEEAKEAYDIAALKHFGEFAKL